VLSSLQTNNPEDVKKHLRLQHIYAIMTLVIIAVIAFGFRYAPILYSDDWSLILGRWYFGRLNWVDLTEQRPLLKVPLVVLYHIFGLNVHAFYAILWVLNIVAAIQLYLLILKLMPKNRSVALAIAALVLVYPADFTHMWLTMIMIRFVVVLTLLYAYLLLVYSETRHQGALWGGLLCLAFSFGIYEGQLGITMIWAILLALIKRTNGWRRWSTLLWPLVIGALFLLWRTAGYAALGIKDNYGYTDRLVITPGVIIGRLIMGARIMVLAWVEPLSHAFGLEGWQAAGILLLLATLCVFLVYTVSKIYQKLAGRYLTQQQYLDQLRHFMLLMLVGIILIAAGYIPYIMFFEPTYFPYSLSSRGNLFAVPGAAITLVALLTIVALLFSRRYTQINLIVLAGVLPLILLGMMVQIQVQDDNRLAWEQQKQIWHTLFELAPDLKDGTSVHFILSDNDRVPSLNKNGVRPPLGPKSQVATAVNMLYGKHNLDGNVFIREPLFMQQGFILKKLFLEEGVKSYTGTGFMPYDRTIFMAYDGNPRRLRIIEDLEAEKLVNFPVSNYAPYDRIIATPTTRVDLRWLVGLTADAGTGSVNR
jgi:hypothetical protein